MTVRRTLATLQLPVAGLGLVALLLAASGIASVDPPAGEAGFVGGLAILALYVLGWIGLCLFAVGLTLPGTQERGIQFRRGQRALFALAAVAALLTGVGPFVAFGLVLSNPTLLVQSVLALAGTAVLSLLVGLGWRGWEWLQTRGSGGAATTEG